MNRKERTKEELHTASNWLIYEYWMVMGLSHILQHHDELVDIDVDVGLFRNAVLDSLLLHSRAVVDFFYRESKYPDDAIATDFLENPEKSHWRDEFSGDPEWFHGIRRRIDKGVAHISYERSKDSWNYVLIEQEISKVFAEFVNRISLEKLGSRWDEVKKLKTRSSDISLEQLKSALPSFLAKGGILKSSFYPLLNPEWYPDEDY